MAQHGDHGDKDGQYADTSGVIKGENTLPNSLGYVSGKAEPVTFSETVHEAETASVPADKAVKIEYVAQVRVPLIWSEASAVDEYRPTITRPARKIMVSSSMWVIAGQASDQYHQDKEPGQHLELAAQARFGLTE